MKIAWQMDFLQNPKENQQFKVGQRTIKSKKKNNFQKEISIKFESIKTSIVEVGEFEKYLNL